MDKTVNRENYLITEKYRPNKIDPIIGQYEIKKILKVYVKHPENKPPNFLLLGPPGIGKTSSILCFTEELNIPKTSVLEINASEKRGVEGISNDITRFASKSTKENYKIIILDEADSITEQAQMLLEKLIKKFNKRCLFCFICNNECKINKCIKSKCVTLRFYPIKNKLIKKQLLKISSNKRLINDITKISSGDLRKAINYVQFLSPSQKLLYDGHNNIIFYDFKKIKLLYNMLLDPLSKINELYNFITDMIQGAVTIDDINSHLTDMILSDVSAKRISLDKFKRITELSTILFLNQDDDNMRILGIICLFKNN